jgi:hypothetical protein
MNAHTFDGNTVNCPICHRNSSGKPGELWGGLYTCPYCQARLVISWSGHYVRDPFSLNQMARGWVAPSYRFADFRLGNLIGLPDRERQHKLRFLAESTSLRRQSRPLARILRDVGLTKRPVIFLVLAGAAIAGMSLANFQGWTLERNPVQKFWEEIAESWEQP